MGLIIPLLFIFFFIMENLESNKYKNIYLLAPFLILTIGLTILFWPFLWENPLNILLSIKSMSSYAWDGLVYFEDTYYPGKFLPWYYLPKIIIITSPLLYLILFIYGILIITKNLSKNLLNLKNNNLWNNFEELYCFYSIIIIFSTIIIITELNSTIYNGWRQIYFIYPSIIFICVYGLNKLLKFKNYKNPIFFLLFIGIIYIIGWNYQNHPHQYVYYNLLINKKNIRNYELDYWGVSNLEILKKISEIENYKNKNIYIFSESPYQYSLKMIEKNKVENFNFVNNINNADLIITNHYYQSKDPKIEEKYLKKSNFKLIYEIRSNNVRINSIYKKKMRLFIYKSIVIFVGIYLLYNFTIGKTIDQYESKLIYFVTDQGREDVRNLIRKELKNTIDNENVFDPEDRVLVKELIEKIRIELGY